MAEITAETQRVIRSVARKYPDRGAIGREDLEQVALEAIWQHPDQGELPPALAATVARRAIIDELRTKGVIRRNADGSSEIVQMPVSFDTPAAEGGLTHHEREGRSDLHDPEGMEGALRGLSDRQRRIAVLLALGYVFREVGAELGVGESRVSQIVDGIRHRIVLREGSLQQAVRDPEACRQGTAGAGDWW